MPLALVDDELDVLAGVTHRIGHELGLRHRDHEVVGALEEQQLAVQVSDVVHR